MSRQIDISKPLSAEDLEYLDSRARQDLIDQNARLLAEAENKTGKPLTAEGAEGAPSQPNDGHTGDVDHFRLDTGAETMPGTHPGEKPVTAAQAVTIQQVSDLGGENKDPAGLVAEVPQPTRQAGDAFEGENASSSEGDNYDDEKVWSYKDLQEEAKTREGVAANGSREEIVAALREDDAKSE